MKKTSKELYVSLEQLNGLFLRDKEILSERSDFHRPIKLTLSWEIPDKKIEISESEFDNIVSTISCDLKQRNEYGIRQGVFTMNGIEQVIVGVTDLKQKLFGKTE